MEKTINIDGKSINFKATALTPRLYLTTFKRDMIKDLYKLNSAIEVNEDTGEAMLSEGATEIFMGAAYVMAKQANDPTTEGKGYEEWLDGFSIFGLYKALPQIYALWGANTATSVNAKKKHAKQLEK